MLPHDDRLRSPDYYADYPKARMGGWGSTGINIAPDGTVLPCHAAATIPGLQFDRGNGPRPRRDLV